jgi:tRNA pseudouridine38-40 synthase
VTAHARCARAIIEYDGTAFAGSQVQPNARTVQGELEEALNRLIGDRMTVRLAGRTDAGVHATGQVAAFCVPLSVWERFEGWPDLRRRLNAVLPPDLAVRALRSVSGSFDPRRDARWRVYRYRILTGAARRPLDRHRTLVIDDRLDVVRMRAAAARMIGERDFGSLGSDARGRTVRHLAEVRVTQRGDLVEVVVTVNAFLRRMVRSIVAILLAAGRDGLEAGDVDRLLAAGERALDGRAAPARGLTLERVVYGSAINRIESNETVGPNGSSADEQGSTGEQGT